MGLFEPGGVVSERDARRVVNRALEATVDGLEGIGPDEDIVDFLGRAAQFSNLGRALEEDVWLVSHSLNRLCWMVKLISGMAYYYRVELVYQIVLAREKYMREASDEEKKGKSLVYSWRRFRLLRWSQINLWCEWKQGLMYHIWYIGNQDRMTAMAWRAEELLQEAGDH